jgi:hypothetical protein
MTASHRLIALGAAIGAAAFALVAWWPESSSGSEDAPPAVLHADHRVSAPPLLPAPFTLDSPAQSAPLPEQKPVLPLVSGRGRRFPENPAPEATALSGETAVVRLIVGTAAGVVPDDLYVVTWGDRGLLAAHRTRLGRAPNGSGTPGLARLLQLPVPSHGRVRIDQLAPEHQMAVCLVDSRRTLVWGPKRFRTFAGEPRDLFAQLTVEPAAIEVLVRDPGGVPIAGAQVQTIYSKTLQIGTTGEGGTYTVKGCDQDQVELFVAKQGFGTLSRKRLKVPSVGQALVVTLQPELVVTVCLQDWTGRAIEQGAVTVRVGRRPVPPEIDPREGTGDRDGCHVVRGLPPRPVILVVTVAGREFQQAHDARLSDRTTITLPAHGSLALRWQPPLDPSHEYRLLLSGRSTGDGRLEHVLTANEVADSALVIDHIFEARYRVELSRIEHAAGRETWTRILRYDDVAVRTNERADEFLSLE